jgi:hypothetical protein
MESAVNYSHRQILPIRGLVPEFEMQPLDPPACGLYSVHSTLNTAANYWTLALN